MLSLTQAHPENVHIANLRFQHTSSGKKLTQNTQYYQENVVNIWPKKQEAIRVILKNNKPYLNQTIEPIQTNSKLSLK